MKIGHVHLKVRDLDAATRFYTSILDMTVRERVGSRFAFLSGTEAHHELALQEVGPDVRSPGRFDTGLFHAAFEVPDKPALARSYQRLRALGVPTALVDHRISWAMYFSDPDGNGLEIYCDTRMEPDGSALWDGHDRPLPAEQLLAVLQE